MINGTMMQAFHWYLPADGGLWNSLSEKTAELADSGFSALWLPPAFKGRSGGFDVGYGPYDLYDLGEFDQRGSIRTKYGTKEEYLRLIGDCHDRGMHVYADIVLNHKAGADAYETVRAKRVRWNDRRIEYGDETDIYAWTSFAFPGRGDAYSPFKWSARHFDGVDWDERNCEKAIFKFVKPDSAWEDVVGDEAGNYDYLMFADLDFTEPEVREEIRKWGVWYLKATGVDGFRLDAIKHISFEFFHFWLDAMREATGRELFTVGEFWSYDRGLLQLYLEKSCGSMSLFDAPLHLAFYQASRDSGYDLRRLFDSSLVKENPVKAVTLVDNHDTQPLQSLESPVDFWFKPLAYACILLRRDGYPCVFYPDWFGARYADRGRDGDIYEITLAPVPGLKELVKARRDLASGTQRDYFDFPKVVGWTREGDPGLAGTGLAVLMSSGSEGWKWMEMGPSWAGRKMRDLLGKRRENLTVNESGWARFTVDARSLSVWVSS
jgi:alpha-amylase